MHRLSFSTRPTWIGPWLVPSRPSFAPVAKRVSVQIGFSSRFRGKQLYIYSCYKQAFKTAVYDKFIDKLKVAIEKHVVVGDGSKPGTTIGPLINKRAVDKVAHMNINQNPVIYRKPPHLF